MYQMIIKLKVLYIEYEIIRLNSFSSKVQQQGIRELWVISQNDGSKSVW